MLTIMAQSALIIALCTLAETTTLVLDEILVVNASAECQHYQQYICLTLQELQSYSQNITSNITLTFLEEEYLLNSSIAFDGTNCCEIILQAQKESQYTQISCSNTSAGISFHNIKSVTIKSLKFTDCRYRAAVAVERVDNVYIIGCYFTNNSAHKDSVLTIRYTQNLMIRNSSFKGNNAINGSIFQAMESGNMTVENSCFTHNNASNGTLRALREHKKEHKQHVFIDGNMFGWNIGHFHGALYCNVSYTKIVKNIFMSNSANYSSAKGGAVYCEYNNCTISNNTYVNNSAFQGGAIMVNLVRSINISFETFINNSGKMGAAMYIRTHYKHGEIHSTKVISSKGGTEAVKIEGTTLNFTGDNSFTSNNGSILFKISHISFNGNATFSNNTQGGITSIESRLSFKPSSIVRFSNNINNIGGAISTYGGAIYLYGKVEIIGNRASQKGGGIYAYHCHIVLKKQSYTRPPLDDKSIHVPTTNISGNSAEKGGGMYLVVSRITVIANRLIIGENTASKGGGVFLEYVSYIFIDKHEFELKHNAHLMMLRFENNLADYGGAVYISDSSYADILCNGETNSEKTATTNQCPLQTRILYIYGRSEISNFTYRDIFFSNNTAIHSGSDIFGGLLDRCTSSYLAEITYLFDVKYTGLELIKKIASFDWTDEAQNFTNTTIVSEHISSKTVQLCFCVNGSVDCSQRNFSVSVKKGHPFNVNVVALDQVGQPLNATVISYFVKGGNESLSEGQQTQEIESKCSTLSYTVFSNEDNLTMLHLYPDGPCADKGISKRTVTVHFSPCDCKIGSQRTQDTTNCKCECDPSIKDYAGSCNENDIQVFKPVWINYSHFNSNTYFIHVDCPFDYCKSIHEKPVLSLANLDQQCSFNRSGTVCGKCSEGLSFVLGSSNCLNCTNSYMYLLLIPAFSLAGILLVAFILFLNLTVAVGTINGLIFYANILAANRSIFLPYFVRNKASVIFISWLNLDLGIETCFYDGMNSYEKALLQLAFPIYLFILIAIIIVLCKCSGRVASLLSKRNPVAALCTIVLLSYSKLFQTVIMLLQYINIHYRKKSLVWKYDGNIPYYDCTPRFFIAAAITILGLVYTTLVFSTQWLHRCSHKRLFHWIKSPKYYTLVDAMHAPFTPKTRYWFGLLLYTRILHSAISAFSSSEKTIVYSVVLIVIALLLLKLFNKTTYKNSFCDILETVCLTNLLLLTVGTFSMRLCDDYTFHSHHEQRIYSSYSVIIAAFIFILIIIYHICTFVLKAKDIVVKVWNKIWRRCKRNEDQNTRELECGWEQTPMRVRQQSGAIEEEHIMESCSRIQSDREDLNLLLPLCSDDYTDYGATQAQQLNTPTFSVVDVTQ